MNVAIVHQDASIIKLLDFILSEAGYQISWHCNTGQCALLNCQQQRPDLILIQNHLNDINCAVLIKQIMQDMPTTVIVVTESIDDNPGSIFDAMSAGALDAIIEPHSEDDSLIPELRKKVQNIYSLQTGKSAKYPVSYSPEPASQIHTKTPLIAIGASTGGPAALVRILSRLPEDLPATIVVIQHLDIQFSEGMAEWLNNQLSINVQLAQNGHKPQAANVYLASTNDHLTLNKDGYFEYTAEPLNYPYRPSVDVFFESILKHRKKNILAILLTGMGRDGANGLLSLYQNGMTTIAQDESSCAVYGMPKAAIECEAVEKVCHIDNIADEIKNFITKGA